MKVCSPSSLPPSLPLSSFFLPRSLSLPPSLTHHSSLAGHGLSYTNFSYSNLKVSGRTITVDVTNAGKLAGAEIPQAYHGYPKSAGEPPLVLRGFTTLMLQPGAKATATFPLDAQDTSIWDSAQGAWRAIKGTFKVSVGASSRDIRLATTASF